MAFPFFYIAEYNGELHLILQEETSRHIVQVLRMCVGEQLNLTDGKGNLLACEIIEAHKKHCTVAVKQVKHTQPPGKKISIAISLLKHTDRFEWFLEKATEIGVAAIIPLLCERTEKEKFRFERLNGICISAMLQSQQTWLPVLHQPTSFSTALKDSLASVKLIAHCEDGEKQTIPEVLAKNPLANCIIFIGPEGDFTANEIKEAASMQCHYVSLGETRLRTETAGVVATVLLSY
jgi:16S rRNA (uracil1498-N3)-methyltransferase